MLGAGPEPVQFSAFNLLMKGRSVLGSLVGPPAYFKEMFELCGKDNIRAFVETAPWDQVNEACDRVSTVDDFNVSGTTVANSRAEPRN